MKLIIQLTPEQEQSIYEQIIGNRKGVQLAITPISNPYKGLRKNTLKFIQQLKLKYGNEWIDRNQQYVNDLAYTFKIKDMAQILRNLETVEIIRGERNRIHKFRFID